MIRQNSRKGKSTGCKLNSGFFFYDNAIYLLDFDFGFWRSAEKRVVNLAFILLFVFLLAVCITDTVGCLVHS